MTEDNARDAGNTAPEQPITIEPDAGVLTLPEDVGAEQHQDGGDQQAENQADSPTSASEIKDVDGGEQPFVAVPDSGGYVYGAGDGDVPVHIAVDPARDLTDWTPDPTTGSVDFDYGVPPPPVIVTMKMDPAMLEQLRASKPDAILAVDGAAEGEQRKTVAKAEGFTLVVKREHDGKIRITSNSFTEPVVVLAGQRLELVRDKDFVLAQIVGK